MLTAISGKPRNAHLKQKLVPNHYSSLQAFINAMYKDEAAQLDAMCRYIKVNNLVNALKNKDWKAFAKGYNGQSYAKNSYDIKLASAYKKWSD